MQHPERPTVERTEQPRVVRLHPGKSLIRLPLGRLGRPWLWVRRQTERFRRALESAVQERHGEVSLYHAKVIRTCVMAVRFSMVINRVLADVGQPGKPEGISHELWLAYVDRQLRLEQIADKAMRDLGLDRTKTIRDAYSEWLESPRNPPADAPA